MKNQLTAQVTGISGTSVGYPAETTPKRLLMNPIPSSNGALMVKQMRLGPKIAETVKEKLSLGAKILKMGGVEKLFKHHFSVREGEKLLKASQCYLSTTTGPIAGLLFISTDKVAFCSKRCITASSPMGQLIIIRYKVLIPVGKTLRATNAKI